MGPVGGGRISSRDQKEGLAAALRRSTQELHREAESGGMVDAILAGRAAPPDYALFLRNLQPAYAAMEAALESHRATPGVRLIVMPELYRAAALEGDLDQLAGGEWRQRLPLLPEGAHYAARIKQASSGSGAPLIAHAYVRYLGDLSGGQAMARLLARSMKLSPRALGFYAFPQIDDHRAFKARFRRALDEAAGEIDDPQSVIDEAAAAFQFNIELSRAVGALAAIAP